MSTLPVTKDNFDTLTSQPGIVFLDFWAAWCQPCRMFKPIYEKASETNPDITFGSIDVEADPELQARFGFTAIPTLMVYRDGIPIFAQPGALRAPEFATVIQAVRDVDMAKVRAELDRLADTSEAEEIEDLEEIAGLEDAMEYDAAPESDSAKPSA
ncbi:MAG: thioredoxin family protein [Propionibacteriaceae bacterium]|jgi:thioredoxin 1|nr:thioredoxin family protein [Propionibacteriaceae bacterium]